jgi:putative peptidoglycan lipid II flippase
MPQGDRETDAYSGVDEFMSNTSEGRGADAYAHLFRDERDQRDQRPPGQGSGRTTAPRRPEGQRRGAPPPRPASAPSSSAGGKAGGILKSSALMAAGTMVSRITGFLRTLVIAAAIGVASLGDIYQVAYTVPTMVYFLTIGGGLNSVFVPQLVRATRNDEDGGTAYANRLLTLVMVVLALIVAVTVVAAPLLIKVLSPEIANDDVKREVAVTFARYCLPTIFFMGVHVVMGQILNARGRFGAMMWTPVLNNIVVIFTFGMFIWVFGSFSETEMGAESISPEGVRLLGIGTLLGLAVQALAMLPYLREAGFRFRPRFDWRGHGLGKAAKLAKWTFLFVLANQAGLTVVTQLATMAGATAEREGNQGAGIAAYQNAQLIWGMPQAIITVSVMAAVLPRISRAAADGDAQAVRDDLSYGLRTSAVAIVPAAFSFVALGVPMATLMYSSAGESGAKSIGYILMAFGLGLIPFSVQYVVLRGFYAYEDTKTPFFNTVIVAAATAALSGLCFLVLPSKWVVTGMAASYGIAYLIGVQVAVKRLRNRLGGDIDGARITRTYARLVGACVPSAAGAWVTATFITSSLGDGALGSLVAVIAGGIVLLALFFVIGKRMRIEEMTALVGMVRGKLGR